MYLDQNRHIGGISLNQRLELVSTVPPCQGALASQPTTGLQAGYCYTDLGADRTHVSVFFEQFLENLKFFKLKVECNGMTEDMNEVASVETSMPPNTQVDQFVKISQTIKRRLEEDTPIPPKKVCQSFSCKEVAEDSRPPSSLEDPLLLPLETCSIKSKGLDEENKENFVGIPANTENPNFDSILAKTLLAARDKSKNEDIHNPAPKVIVEHQPLPSIYELGQVTRDLDNTMLRSDEESDGDSDEDSSMFDQPPPACSSPSKPGQNFSDRFWSGNFTAQPAPLPTPPPSPVPTVLQPSSQQQPSSTYQFLDQSNPRIECDENGKSYLQLGTVNHHLPVTPVIQPKPTTLTPRRPTQPFRPNPPPPARPPNPTPPCDHSACLARKNSPCYRQQRSRMLNVSLHKLHMARQRADSNLCRSVLICNMLRYIEEESDQEAREQEANFNQQQENTESPYWNNLNNQNINSFAPPTPNPYRDNGYSNESFEPPLKDFNSAFRQTPVPMNTDGDSGIEEDRGINWSSVLSLSSQSDLDPLNNNSFSESWSPSTQDLADVDLSQHSFDDINWKLTPVSADDVLKAFPNDENIFQCPA